MADPARRFSAPRPMCKVSDLGRMEAMTETQTQLSSPSRERPRIAALDIVRGFALCGILVVNLPPIVELGVDGGALHFYRFYQDFVQNRFFPIFSFLF